MDGLLRSHAPHVALGTTLDATQTDMRIASHTAAATAKED